MRSLLLKPCVAVCVSVVVACGLLAQASAQEGASVRLPGGVKAVWDIDKVYRETTPTRERVCINGLWRWQPADEKKLDQPPTDNWGFFKVPGA